MSERTEIIRQDDRGMITLRGDLTSAAMKKAVKAACGQAVPAQGQINGVGAGGVAWMSPDELLVMVPYDDVDQKLAQIDAALKGQHYMAVDVSDARAVFTLTGANAREVLARLSPADLHPFAFGVGQFRRSRLAQIAAAFWVHEGGIDLICFRSVADYAEGILSNAAQGAKIGALDA